MAGAGITQATVDRLAGRDLGSDPRLTAIDAVAQESARCELVAAAGCGYTVGGITIPPPSLASLALLEMLESPLVKPGDTEAGLRDIMLAVYCLAKTREVYPTVARIVRYRRRISERAKAGADMDAIFRQEDEMDAELSRLDADAAAFWDGRRLSDMQEIISQVMAALNDATSGFAAMPQKDGAAQKKTGSPTPTP